MLVSTSFSLTSLPPSLCSSFYPLSLFSSPFFLNLFSLRSSSVFIWSVQFFSLLLDLSIPTVSIPPLPFISPSLLPPFFLKPHLQLLFYSLLPEFSLLCLNDPFIPSSIPPLALCNDTTSLRPPSLPPLSPSSRLLVA